MKKILLSINPEYVERILNKTKRFEYRTKVAKKEVKSILVYCTSPTKMVVAEVKIKSILCDTPNNLWERTKEFSGISKKFFDEYFKNREIAYAYELGEILEYKNPRPLKDFGIEFAPQSFMYIDLLGSYKGGEENE